MLTHGIISKYLLKCFRCIIIHTIPFISISHDDEQWQNIDVLKDLWGTNFPKGTNFQGGANFLEGAKFLQGINF
jgi:hypothetical protein